MSGKRGSLPIMLCLLLFLVLAGCGAVGSQGQGQQSQVQGNAASKSTTATVAGGNGTGSGITLPQQKGTPTPIPAKTATPSSASKHPMPTPAPTMPSGSGGTGSGPYGTPTPPTAQETQLEQQLFQLINSDRASISNLYAYVLNGTMTAGARLHSWNMAHCGGLTHQCSKEAQPCQRVSNEGISWTSCGENVGYTSPYPTAWDAVKGIESAMLNEPPPAGHRMNLLNSGYHRIGVGIYIDSKGYIWITEDFAS